MSFSSQFYGLYVIYYTGLIINSFIKILKTVNKPETEFKTDLYYKQKAPALSGVKLSAAIHNSWQNEKPKLNNNYYYAGEASLRKPQNEI